MTKPLIIATPILAAAFGYLAGLQPTGEWRWFSWHPFLMVLAFVGFMGSGSMIKKMGGYTNTKVHGILGSLGTMCALGGFYVIYTNKNELGKDHFTTPHGKAGLLCLIGSIMVGSAGGVFLHPDFGVDKTNKTIRKVHSWASRFVIGLGWLACFSGLRTIAANDPKMLAGYVIPMLCLVPQVLVPGMTKAK
eukprot:CAMPEP_0196814382 /NCGR_PEP_ID=MMETSP1362-20130617/42927_1 /TAXON_ID=163516 /ORGANISM="Leptocylindrus danicus, Strain CCMP1856" /LENGTH=190 /DNA_ID=CAMNT_0042190973 /DNA_START=56 /DNA_END=628 /DNA_ORIENTATION=+